MRTAPWHPEELERLLALRNTHSASQIGKILGRSRHSVLGRLFRDGLCKPNPQTWTEEKKQKLIALFGMTENYTEIADGLGSDRNSVKRQLVKLKLIKPDKKRKSSPVRYLEPGKPRKHLDPNQRVHLTNLAAEELPFGVPFEDLKEEHCRWIPEREDGQKLYCGESVDPGKPYCFAHCCRAYLSGTWLSDGIAT